jgi:phage terminase large subunit
MLDIQFPEKLQCLFVPARYKVLYGGRGGAKSWGVARALLILASQTKKRILCGRELQNSIKDSVHKLLSDQIEAMGLSKLYVIEQARIYCPSTGSEIFFEGIRNNVAKIKSYEGIDILWMEEADKATKSSWGIVIPTIRKEGSEIWITFNPNLEEDDTYQRFVVNPPKNAIVVKISWRDNPWFPKTLYDEMVELREKDFDEYLHVWEGECKRALEGAVYAAELRELYADGRVTSVPHHRAFRVNTYWDIGRSDSTSIWFEQYFSGDRRIIDFYEARLKDLEHFVQMLKDRKGQNGQAYEYGTHWLPFDAGAKRFGTKRTVEEQLRDAFRSEGARVRLTPKISKFDGIMALRTIFPTMHFDQAKTAQGLRSISHYHYIEDQDTGVFSKEPVHDWSSHAADALRYLAVASSNATSEEASKRTKSRLHAAMDVMMGNAPGPQGWMGQ